MPFGTDVYKRQLIHSETQPFLENIVFFYIISYLKEKAMKVYGMLGVICETKQKIRCVNVKNDE